MGVLIHLVFEKIEQASEESTEQATYADSISYVHRDILGSGELITDSRMNILARQFFSPYGEKVDDLLKAQAQVAGETYQAAKLGTGMIQSESDDLGADLWAKYEQAGEGDEFLSRFTAGASALDLTGVRGFTSHEAIEEIGLINMNARLYDPVIGRFMSADSMVPDLYTPLDHNRYSYVRGNPVIARDPTGHFPWLAAAAAFYAWSHYGDNPTLQMASTVLLSAAMMNPSTTPFAAGANATANAAMHSGLTSLTISFLKTGKIDRKSMENAGIAAASAGLTHSIAHGWIKDNTFIGGGEYEWAKITAAHMLTQGAISDLRGDKFIHGAIAGLAAKAGEGLVSGDNIYVDTVIVSTLSGIAAEATGGDFAQGAMTGAIIHLYNSEGVVKGFDKLTKFWFGGGVSEAGGQYFSETLSQMDEDLVQSGAVSKALNETSRWSGHAGAALSLSVIGAPLGGTLLSVSTASSVAAAGWDHHFHNNDVSAMAATSGAGFSYLRDNIVNMVPEPMKFASKAYMFGMDRLSQEAFYHVGSQ